MFRNNIETALKAEDSTGSLREFVFELNGKGYKKEEIYSIFYKCSLELAKEGREEDSELLEDIMDMVIGWYVGRNIDLD